MENRITVGYSGEKRPSESKYRQIAEGLDSSMFNIWGGDPSVYSSDHDIYQATHVVLVLPKYDSCWDTEIGGCSDSSKLLLLDNEGIFLSFEDQSYIYKVNAVDGKICKETIHKYSSLKAALGCLKNKETCASDKQLKETPEVQHTEGSYSLSKNKPLLITLK